MAAGKVFGADLDLSVALRQAPGPDTLIPGVAVYRWGAAVRGTAGGWAKGGEWQLVTAVRGGGGVHMGQAGCASPASPPLFLARPPACPAAAAPTRWPPGPTAWTCPRWWPTLTAPF